MKAKITVEMRLKRYNFFLVEFILFLGLNKLANTNTNTNAINPKNGNIFTVSTPPQFIYHHNYPTFFLLNKPASFV